MYTVEWPHGDQFCVGAIFTPGYQYLSSKIDVNSFGATSSDAVIWGNHIILHVSFIKCLGVDEKITSTSPASVYEAACWRFVCRQATASTALFCDALLVPLPPNPIHPSRIHTSTSDLRCSTRVRLCPDLVRSLSSNSSCFDLLYEIVKLLQFLYCKCLPASVLIDVRKILFWRKMLFYHSNILGLYCSLVVKCRQSIPAITINDSVRAL